MPSWIAAADVECRSGRRRSRFQSEQLTTDRGGGAGEPAQSSAAGRREAGARGQRGSGAAVGHEVEEE